MIEKVVVVGSRAILRDDLHAFASRSLGCGFQNCFPLSRVIISARADGPQVARRRREAPAWRYGAFLPPHGQQASQAKIVWARNFPRLAPWAIFLRPCGAEQCANSNRSPGACGKVTPASRVGSLGVRQHGVPNRSGPYMSQRVSASQRGYAITEVADEMSSEVKISRFRLFGNKRTCSFQVLRMAWFRWRNARSPAGPVQYVPSALQSSGLMLGRTSLMIIAIVESASEKRRILET